MMLEEIGNFLTDTLVTAGIKESAIWVSFLGRKDEKEKAQTLKPPSAELRIRRDERSRDGTIVKRTVDDENNQIHLTRRINKREVDIEIHLRVIEQRDFDGIKDAFVDALDHWVVDAESFDIRSVPSSCRWHQKARRDRRRSALVVSFEGGDYKTTSVPRFTEVTFDIPE